MKVKEKIRQLSREIFEYELPKIILSKEKLQFEVETDHVYQDSFVVSNSENRSMKGILYSSNPLMQLEDTSFVGKENTITFAFHAKDLTAKDNIEGVISLVSSCGEIEIPYIATIIEPYVNTSLGMVKDLFHFANLAKTDWAEAMKIFKSESFERIFLQRDLKTKVLYHSLLQSVSTSQALEEFLVAIRKKTVPSLSMEEKSFSYTIGSEKIADKVTLTKDSWGYLEIKISADAKFIIPEHKIIWAENFIGNHYTLGFELDPDFMRNGKNYGKIILKSVHQTLEMKIEVDCKKQPKERDFDYFKKKECELRIVNNYLHFRSNRMEITDYVEETRSAIRTLEEIENILKNLGKAQYSRSLDLFKIHLYLVEGNEEKAKDLLDSMEKDRSKLEKSAITDYCGYLYLKALFTKADQDVEEAVQVISKCYTQETSKWAILWYLLFLDRRFEHDKPEKLKAIAEQYNNGCHSPVLYYEVCDVYNAEPTLLKELDALAIQAFYMGVKMDCITPQVAAQYAYLAAREKKFNRLIYKSLEAIYEKYQTKDILSAICSLLIKAEKTEEQYFEWYRLGVEKQLRITELHEYYMYSIQDNYEGIMPQEIYLYFSYNNNLPERKKAFLYANIVKNEDSLETIYQACKEQMILFTMQQLEKHHIDENIAVLYNTFLQEDNINEKVALHLPYVMFSYVVYCASFITGIFIVHKECTQEVYVPVEHGKAYGNIFTEGAKIFFEDAKGNRYSDTIPYEVQKLVNLDKLAEKCYTYNKENEMLLLYLYEQIDKYQKSDMNMVTLQKSFDTDLLQESYKRKWTMKLIQHYYNNYEDEALEHLLQNIDMRELNLGERSTILEYCIIRGLYDFALEKIREFGPKGIAVKRLLSLCSKVLQNLEQEVEEPNIVALAFYVFQTGKYDEATLRYLAKYFLGTTKEMFELWRAARECEIETMALEERLLGQVLFAESYMQDALAVFLSYYKMGRNHVLMRAFVSYYAYKYLVNDRVVADEFFEVVKKEIMQEESDVCLLALIKYYSTLEEITQEQLKFVDYSIHKLVEKGLVLSFFKAFDTRIKLPNSIRNKLYVEYKTNPKNKVYVHYFIEDEEMGEGFLVEQMKNMYYGIHVKEFNLFYNETLQYYISETDEKGESITESTTRKLDAVFEKEEDKYSQINLMLVAREMQDEKTLLELMESYIKTEYAMTEAFKML